MIIIEGVDKAGKTTLARRLFEEYRVPTRKFGIPDGDPIPDYITAIKRVRSPIIFDRFIYGEVPYSIVKRPDHRYMFEFELRQLELMIMSIPHIVVYCRPSRQEVSDRLEREGDDYVDLVELHSLYEEYDEMLSVAMCKTYIYDNTNYDQIKRLIETHALDERLWNRYGMWQAFNHEGIGTLQPYYLFIGEKYNFRAKHQVPFWSKAGRYLHARLGDVGIDLKTCHFTNALSQSLKPISKNLIKLLKPHHVICLGDVAWENVVRFQEDLHAKDITISKIPHPAYWSRFVGDDFKYNEGLKLSCGL